MKANVLCLLVLLVSSMVSCNENGDKPDSTVLEGIAIVNKYGNENEGDCGFMLVFNDTLYKPINLGESFKINALQVYVKFELLGSVFSCGDIAEPPHVRELEKIKILEIRTE